jgi:hypothetical protein
LADLVFIDNAGIEKKILCYVVFLAVHYTKEEIAWGHFCARIALEISFDRYWVLSNQVGIIGVNLKLIGWSEAFHDINTPNNGII